MALEAMRQGTASRTDWVTLRDAAAMTETMAYGGAGPEALGDASGALGVLSRTHNLDGPLPAPEVQALSEMLAYHDEQRRLLSRSEVLVWVKKTVEKFNAPNV